MAVPWRRSGRLDADAVEYFSRIAAIGGGFQNGAYSERGTKRRLSDFILSLKDLGVWTSISEMGIFLGVSDLPACLVKARYAPGTPASLTNINFVGGDYTPTDRRWAQGDGATKYLTTGVNQNTLAQNAHSLWVYVTNAANSAASEALIGSNLNPGVQITKATDNSVGARVATTNPVGFGVNLSPGLVGFCRNGATTIDWCVGSSMGSLTGVASEAMGSATISVLARGVAFPSRSTVAIYGIGSSVNLAGLKTACDAVFSAFGGTP